MIYTYWRMFGENRFYEVDPKGMTAEWSNKMCLKHRLVVGEEEPNRQTKEEEAFEAAFGTPEEAWAALESVIQVFGAIPIRKRTAIMADYPLVH